MKIFNQLYRKVISESFILLFVFLCSFVILIWADIKFATSINILRKILLGFCASLVSGIFFAFICSLFKGYFRFLAKVIIIIMASSFFLFEAFLLKAFDTLFTNFIASVIMESNSNEAKEFFNEMLTVEILSYLFGLLLIIFVFAYCFSHFIMPHLGKYKLIQYFFGLALILGISVMGYNINRFSIRR